MRVSVLPTSTSIEDAALFADMLSLPNNGRHPALDLDPQQRRQRTLGALVSHIETFALERRGIKVREAAIAKVLSDDGCLRTIRFENGEELARQALFFTTGQHPRSTFLENLGCTYDEKGVVCGEHGATSAPGVYVAGDVSRDVQLVIIAAAEGAQAALAINKALLQADGHL